MRHVLGCLCLLFLLSLHPASAQVVAGPPLMNFQGRLTKPDGTPVPDASYSIRFSLWSAASGGSEKWNQTSTIAVKNGTYAVLLNFTAGFTAGNNISTAFNNNTFLELKIGVAAPLTPRQQLVSVAYALKANTVPDGAIGAAQLASNAVTNVKVNDVAWSKITGVPAEITNAWSKLGNSGTNPSTNFLGTTDNQPLVFRTNNLERFRFDTAGRAFLGRPNPIGSGRLILSEDTGSYTGMYIDSGAGGWPFYGYSQNSASNTWTFLDGSDSNKWKLYHNGTRIAVTTGGNVGINTSNPENSLSVAGSMNVDATNLNIGTAANYFSLGAGSGEGIGSKRNAGGNQYGLDFYTGFVNRMSITNGGNVAIGTTDPGSNRLFVTTPATAATDVTATFYAPNKGGNFSHIHYGVRGDWYIRSASSSGDIIMQDTGTFAWVGIGKAPSCKLDVAGLTRTSSLEILGGSDVAESYLVAPTDNIKPIAGMVVVIDQDKVGQMKVASKAYDTTVAGIVSGANGVNPGLTLRQVGSVADGTQPVASVGRVWCWCDADANGPIAAGDLLTTSATPGHAMKVSDHTRSQGAILGKAMSSLKRGKGLVLILVTLQ